MLDSEDQECVLSRRSRVGPLGVLLLGLEGGVLLAVEVVDDAMTMTVVVLVLVLVLVLLVLVLIQ